MVKCPECGHENPDWATGCGECGHDLTKVNKQSQETKKSAEVEKPKKSKSSNNNLIIAVVAIVVVIAIVGIFASGMFNGDNSQSTAVSDNSESVSPIVENDTSNDSNSEDSNAEYWASQKTDKFHLPTCEWAEKISENNKIVYHSRDDAISDGKQPCGVCNP